MYNQSDSIAVWSSKLNLICVNPQIRGLDPPLNSRSVTDKVDAILEEIEQDWNARSYVIAEGLRINYKTVLNHLKKAGYRKSLILGFHINSLKEMWDEKGIIHYELLLSGKTINWDLYCQQLMRLKSAPGISNSRGVVLDHRYALKPVHNVV
ncbi:hypothetical protein EVAR_67686_1 [Eumeta japonica]|uniref:Histone-lysine N-methyltransferase SETMAR n=1 Tax=Eumeta variegata TaxID=151549 RepID=A0A4C1ZPF1_EUMVA|nr:hypothetical protein EVAR_67686_1 [Eumeta japonica]